MGHNVNLKLDGIALLMKDQLMNNSFCSRGDACESVMPMKVSRNRKKLVRFLFICAKYYYNLIIISLFSLIYSLEKVCQVSNYKVFFFLGARDHFCQTPDLTR